jgi:hypothetical protein
LAAPLQAKTIGAQCQPKSGTTRQAEAERTKSGSADKENKCPEGEHGCLENENELQEGGHGRNAPDDQDDDNGYI